MPSLAAGTQLGPYVIESPLGEGGMGEVYRARDTTLNRLVALKILPDVFAADPDRLSRFEREAQVLAQLNHPHIAQIYGFERSHRALAMELVEGDDLAARLTHGPLPVDEALAVATQLADALEAAHEHGIVHRDLKPANIKVRADGAVKVLDFGLAKPGAIGSASAIDLSPTITSPVGMTAQGMILGTAAYMAPEQARGKPVDRRADIWAFGCVLYEMLTSRRAFDGETVTDLLAAVVTRDPDWSVLPPATPPHVRTLLARCLVKDPRQRLRDIGDARIELTRPVERTGADALADPAMPPRGSSRWLPWAITAVAVVVASIALAMTTARTSAPDATRAGDVTRFTLQPPQGAGSDTPGTLRLPGVVTVSPDGRRLAMLATTPGGRLWIRDVASTTPVQLPGSDRAIAPFWSPDSRKIGFFADGRLKTVDLNTSTIQDLVSGVGITGGTWNADGIILVGNGEGGIMRVSERGGEATAITTLDRARGDRRHTWPVFLPDGRRFLFHATTDDADTTGIYLGSLDTRDLRFVVATPGNVAYAPPGYLLYVRGTALVAQAFDPDRGELGSDVHPVTPAIAFNNTNRHAEFSVSNTGTLVYATGGLSDLKLAWFDRQGKKTGSIDAIGHMDIALDNTRVAADRFDDAQSIWRDIWVFDERRGSRTRLTFSPQNDWVPKWSPDGTRIAFTSDRETPDVAQIYVRAADGSGADELLLKTDKHKHHLDWSRDGRLLIFEQDGNRTDLWMLPLDGPREPKPLLQGPFNEAQPSLSPDARYLGYASNESGVYEVYVQAMPPATGRWQISTSGGVQPLWRGDGSEMYYLAADGQIMALDVDLKTPSFGVPKALFLGTVIGDATTEHVAVTTDGQRFLMQDRADASRGGLTVVLNWLADLRK